MEVEHFSHPHPLTLNTDEQLNVDGKEVICSGCEESISRPPSYTCTSCNDFFLHKKCFELPMVIKRPLHPKHTLFLLAKPPSHYSRCFCDICRKTCRSFVYHCPLCDFDLDIQCAFQSCINCEGEGRQEHHFSHPHQLTLNTDEQLNVDGKDVICSGCEESISGPPSYTCTYCNDFFLHKKCFELPMEIKRPLHPKHTLFLLEKPPSYYSPCVCDICRKTCMSYVYHCPLCEFNLDIQCAFPSCINYEGEGQGHHFRCLANSISLKSFSFTCSACGTDGDACPFMCTMCQLMVHKECISPPRTIETMLHSHRRLIQTYYLHLCLSVKQYCGVCRLEVDTNYGGYHCPDCDFVAHAKCAREVGGSESSESEEESEGGGEQSATRYNEFVESAFTIVREIKHGEEKTIAEIKHFSHQHNLVFIDKIFDDHLKCDGCILPISTPFYGCTECRYFLDKTCLELPRQKKFQYHKHPMTLIPMAVGQDGFICNTCHQYCHGFRYSCERCDIRFDVRCLGIFKESIEHTVHEHPLFLATESKNYRCGSCGVDKDGDFGFLRCIDCDFNLDPACAALPQKARHKYDDHPLFLTSLDPNTYQFVCQICEKDRDPKLWFYRCEECDFDAHPRCALGKYPFLKFGNAHTYGFHPHPLALVDKTDSYPDPYRACCNCRRSCNDIALECTDSECDFIIHGKGRDRTDPDKLQLLCFCDPF